MGQFPGDASRNTHDAVRIRVQEQTVDAEDAAAKEQSRATKRRDEKKSRDKRAALEKKNAALVISQAQEITSLKEEINRLQTTTPPPPPVQEAAAVAVSPHMRITGLIPHIMGLMELAASKKRKADCLGFISRMGEDELKEITRAVKERMDVVKPSKKKK